MTENEIGTDNEYDNGDEFDKVQNTFPTGSGLFELSDTPGTMPSRLWRRILPVTVSYQRGTSTARCTFVGWNGLVVSSDLLHFSSSVNIGRCFGSQVPRSHNTRLVTPFFRLIVVVGKSPIGVVFGILWNGRIVRVNLATLNRVADWISGWPRGGHDSAQYNR